MCNEQEHLTLEGVLAGVTEDKKLTNECIPCMAELDIHAPKPGSHHMVTCVTINKLSKSLCKSVL